MSNTLSDPGLNQTLFGIDGAALELRSARMGLITSNIANASTPGYKARDIDFAAALKSELAGADTNTAANAAIKYRVPVMPSLDGNTVDMGSEQVAFSENATGYATSLAFLTDRVDRVNRALKGD